FYMSMADPFGFVKDGRYHILYESIDPLSRQGSIEVIEYSDDGKFVRKEPIFSEKSHMSYPYIVCDRNNIYVLREFKESCNLELFMLENHKIIDQKILLEDFCAVDPSIVFYKDMWWLFCTKCDSLECEELYAFYSANLHGGWKAHENNPIKKNIASARPAGTPFVHEGNLYRPTQDCSKEYGKRIIMNKVVELDSVRFREETVYYIETDQNVYYRDGIHTISQLGEKTLIDARKWVFKYKLRETMCL
ncbi:MAG: hypothetical protein JXN10_07975, partial [Clostridia bacterium]|nr:hypothetical protein [Clostridia bacterium]